MSITGNELVNLMFTPMTDIKIIETINSFGLEQPTIDEEYEEKGKVSVDDDANSGITFVFKELDGYSKDGEPCLAQIDFEDRGKVEFPFNLKTHDNYRVCCEKIGKKADFRDRWVDEAKVWIMETANAIKYSLAINFMDDDFNTIDNIVLVDFQEEEVGDTLLENKD